MGKMDVSKLGALFPKPVASPSNGQSIGQEPLRKLAAGASDEYSCEFGSTKYFTLCALGGVLSCGITHTAVTPLDLVKCRLQVDKEKYKNLGNGFKLTMAEGGAAGLFLGWAPTAIGYSAQGLCKFGFYEVFKKVYGDAMGEENAYLYMTGLYLAASASAEFLADEGINGFYKSLVPLWGRQIPYTMMKFACFEKTVVALYDYVVPKPRAECSKGEQLIVTFAAGYIAGVFCAIVSHPADTLVSYLNKAPGAGIGAAVNTLGFNGLWGGLGPRIIMIGTLTALQWFIYDGVKVQLRLPRPPPPEMPASLKAKMAAAQS